MPLLSSNQFLILVPHLLSSNIEKKTDFKFLVVKVGSAKLVLQAETEKFLKISGVLGKLGGLDC
jgi:hypothetical protein